MTKFILWALGSTVLIIIIGGLQRRFASHTLINGCMDEEKAKELCPEIFNKNLKKTTENPE